MYWKNNVPPSPLKRPWALQVSVAHFVDPHLPGLSEEAATKLIADNGRQIRELLDLVIAVVRQNEPKFREIAIAINCVGGKARSVAMAEITAAVLRAHSYEVVVTHLDIDRPLLEKIECVED